MPADPDAPDGAGGGVFFVMSRCPAKKNLFTETIVFYTTMKNHHFQFQNRLIKLYLPGIWGCPAEAMLKRVQIPADFGAQSQIERSAWDSAARCMIESG